MTFKTVSELFGDIKIGGTPSRGSSAYFGGNNLWVSIKDMGTQDVITSTAEHLTNEGVANSNCKLVAKGSLLFSFKLTVGKIAFAGEDLYTNEAIAAFEPLAAQRADIDLEFLSLVLPSIAQSDSTKNCMGAPLLNKRKILSLKIPHPDLLDQRRIAAHLKTQLAEVDKARKAIETQIKELIRLKTKMVNELFLDAKPVRPIGVAAKVQSGYAFKSQAFKSEGIRLLRNANILPGKVYWDDVVYLSADDAQSYPTYELHDGDVLISLDRPIISSGIKIARVSQDDLPALLLQRVGRFLINQEMLVPDYLYAFLHTDIFRNAITGHDQSLGVPHISPKQVEGISIPLPGLSKQNEIAAMMRELHAQLTKARKAAETKLAEINLLPQKILSAAFGEAGA